MYKQPKSVLVVIYCISTKRFLLLQRKDDPNFWQSVTGSLEPGEIRRDAAIREVKEETAIDIHKQHLTLIDCHYYVEFEIFPQFRHRYAPDVTHNKEHWFYLPLLQEQPVLLTEHLAYQWMDADQAIAHTISWNNRQAIEQCYQTQFN